ncbi:hypothetical protein CDD82_4149 [Ophiocordyceps australis]|uniref:HRDC domain-containing protein n=1 Tax=Ophiocordyceps australis TaxID=1399860 RepID=A0A2C5ZA69_9HYPO|nr:hypothetical protein CDD82_4149 [Ophiocordyceps australis]
MEPSDNFKSLQQTIQDSLVSTVKYVNRIAAEDLTFQRTVNPGVADQLDHDSTRVLALSSRLLQSAASACGVKASALEDPDDIDLAWQSIVDVVDSLLEKADTALDEFTGLVKRREPASLEPRTKSTANVIRHANITKPQTRFQVRPHNFPTGPWSPILTQKPHASLPLDKSLVTFTAENNTTQYKHPYFTEISEMKYPPHLYQQSKPIPPQPIQNTSAIWVDTYDGVLNMLQELQTAAEIAVDLEHHDYRTYNGLVCLMQISTRQKDWIIDTLQPWRHKLEILNKVFADPSIVKVFHGAYMDMVWLQRDLGLYVNGLFDTFFACELLAYPSKSLAFLLSKFVDFDADKKYQLADWRIRPIPSEMLYYAQSDTHFLLYIYDNLRNELVSSSNRKVAETDYIERALERSRQLSLSRHEHPDYDAQSGQGSRGWYNHLLKNAHLNFDGEQFAMFRALWDWRDATARREDENPIFILSPNSITNIVHVNPPDAKALHSLLPPGASVAKAHVTEIWTLLQEARAKGGPSVLHFLNSSGSGSSFNREVPLSTTLSTALSTNVSSSNSDIAIPTMARSRLFGDMALSTIWETTHDMNLDSDQDLVPFPWQQFVQENSSSDLDELKDDIQQPQAGAETAPDISKTEPDMTAEDLDEEFTLKAGRKRSHPREEEEEEKEEEVIDEGASEGVILMEENKGKPSNKKKRKKHDKREAHKKKGVDNGKGTEATAFDYSQAASVLHAKRDKQEVEPEGKKKVFNPYGSTAEDGLKGARKAPPVRGERSTTFAK